MVATSRMIGSQEEALPGRGHGWHAASPVSKDHLSQLTGDDDLAPMCHEVAQLSSAAETAQSRPFRPVQSEGNQRLLLLTSIAGSTV